MADNIVIQNKEKINEFIFNSNPENFFVIADFGRTFTKCFSNGEKISTSFSIIRNEGYLGEEYIKRALEYFDKYHPIEVDENRGAKEKITPLTEWWKLHLELLVDYGFNKEIIKELIKNNKFPLRRGVSEFLDLLNKNNIPLIIVSQGLGDIYIESLRNISKLYNNIYFVSNLFEFDKKGKAIGVKKTIIHPFNKSDVDLRKFDFFKEIENRKNVLLLGDSLEDVGVANKLSYDNIMKIGFLNENISKNLEDYKKNFDVLILNDSDMQYVNEVVMKIIR